MGEIRQGPREGLNGLVAVSRNFTQIDQKYGLPESGA
jgi:hypothetical protein